MPDAIAAPKPTTLSAGALRRCSPRACWLTRPRVGCPEAYHALVWLRVRAEALPLPMLCRGVLRAALRVKPLPLASQAGGAAGTPGAAGSSREQPGAAGSSREQPGAAGSSREQPGAAGSSQSRPISQSCPHAPAVE